MATLHLGTALLHPQTAFSAIAADPPSGMRVFFGASLWLALCPPIFAYVGSTLFGWRLGVEPLLLAPGTALAISVTYFVFLVVGLLSAAFVAHWMAGTYGADTSFAHSLALMTLVAVPLAIGSIVHLYPNAFFNVMALVPTLIWSMYLLYRGLPLVLKTDTGRGMLMASALIAYLLVSWVTLLGITAVLWSWALARGWPYERRRSHIVRRPHRYRVHGVRRDLGVGRHGRRRLRGRRARVARARFFAALALVRQATHGAHERRDLRLRRMRVDRHVVLQRAAHVARAAVRAEARLVRLLRLAGARRARRSVPARRLDGRQGIRGARVAIRHCHCSALGQLRHRVLRHDREAHDAADLHLELVLRRADHRHRDAAHREQPGHSGHARARATRCSPVRRMPSCSGGTATTPSASC